MSHRVPENNGKPSVPPQAVLLDMMCGMMKTQAIHEATRLGLAELVKDGPRALTDLAAVTETQPAALARLLRALVTLDIFTEVEPDVFAQTAFSHLLRPDVPGSMYYVALLHGEQWQWQSWEGLSYSLHTGKTAFEHLYKEPLWQYFAENPEVGERFSQAMFQFSEQVNASIARSYDFSWMQTLVDVGGGYGNLLTTVLQHNPDLQGILFDLPSVVEGARAHIDVAGLSQRCQVVAGNIFEAIPEGADGYILKQIIKDWDDEQCISILHNCRRAMKPGGRVLVAEQVLLPGKHMSTSKLIDLQLLVVLSGRERYEHEFRRLFEAADLRLARIWPTQSLYSILEGVAA